MRLTELECKFRKVTGYDKVDDILAVVFYGSRVTKNNNATSDLDVLVISKKKGNFKKGFIIDGIKVDCQIYGLDSIYDELYDKKIASNEYFKAVLQNGLVLKNKEKTIELIQDYLKEIDEIKLKKRTIKTANRRELVIFYEDFSNKQDDYSYFNLLEIIRKNYHYLKKFSYISNLKVGKIYTTKEKYEKDYCLNLPTSDFIKLYMEAIKEEDFQKRMILIKKLMTFLNVSLDYDFFDMRQEYFKMYSLNEIRTNLLVFHNKIVSVESLLQKGDSYMKAGYYIVLKEINDFVDFLILDDDVKKQYDELFRKAVLENNNINSVFLLWEIFHLIENDYHFDYDNYVLKL